MYEEVVVPNWENKSTCLTVNPKLASLYEDQNLNNQEIEQLSRELQKVDRWAMSDFKMSKHVFWIICLEKFRLRASLFKSVFVIIIILNSIQFI